MGIRDGQDPWLRGQYVYPETPKRPGGYPRPSAEDRTRALDLLLVDRIAQAEREAPAAWLGLRCRIQALIFAYETGFDRGGHCPPLPGRRVAA